MKSATFLGSCWDSRGVAVARLLSLREKKAKKITLLFLVIVQLDAQIPLNIFIYSSLHVSSMSCSSSGETDCISTASGKCHSVNKWVI